jgi:hypothetical protein
MDHESIAVTGPNGMETIRARTRAGHLQDIPGRQVLRIIEPGLSDQRIREQE